MSDEQIQTEKKAQKCSQSYLDDSSPLTESSDINEEFYRIKAIEEGGLPIEIVGVVPEVSYKPTLAFNSPRGRIKTSSKRNEVDEVTEEFLNLDTERPVFYYSTSFFIDFDIYYSTAFGQAYKASFNQSRSRLNSKYGYTNTKGILNGIIQEVDSSKRLNTISDISSLNTISATLHPDETLTDGKIELNGSKSSFSNCEKVDTNRTGSNNSDAITRFVVKDNYETFGNSCNDTPSDWIWSYISDVREDGETIVLTVETPIGKAVFPYNFNHDTETPFWTLVDEAGSQLTSLRGMDVCIRTRGGYEEVYKNFDIREAGFNHHEYPEYDKKNTNQPINTPNKDGKPLVIDDPTDVNPVGVDAKSAWTLGVPPNNRLETDEISEKVSSDKDSPRNNGILYRITNLIKQI